MAETREQLEDQQLLPLLDHLARVGRRAAEASMAPGGLRPRHLIALKLLSEHGPASQQGLAEALSLDPSNVVGLLNELEERELIVRRRDPADRRRHIVELSATGAGELCLAQARLSRVEDDLLAVLSAAERATLYRLLARAVDAVGGGKQSACTGQAAAYAGEPEACAGGEPEARTGEAEACAGDEPAIC
jgi:MarR family transcriptional regulator, lower aerobic nicotinate degradation pathway regulator